MGESVRLSYMEAYIVLQRASEWQGLPDIRRRNEYYIIVFWMDTNYNNIYPEN